MSYSYRERAKLDNYETEREWTFATAETFSDFLQEHDLTPDLGQKGESSVEVRVGDRKTPEDVDAGTTLTAEIERLRKEAMEKAGKAPPVETPPQPSFLEEVRRANIDAVMKQEYLKTPEDLKRIRDVINAKISFEPWELDSFDESQALLVLRPFGMNQQTSTFVVCEIGLPSDLENADEAVDYVRVFSVEEAATRTGEMRHVTVHFEEVINPAYLPQKEEAGKGISNGGNEPLL